MANDPFAETRRELYELMQRLRHSHIAPPTPDGMTPAEVRVMTAIGTLEDAAEPIRPSRVAEMSHTTPSAASQTFKSLEEKGLIERSRAAGDCRGVAVSLTDEGRRLCDEGRRLCDEHMDAVMAYIGEEDMTHFVRILRKVAEFHTSFADRQPTAGDVSEKGGRPCA